MYEDNEITPDFNLEDVPSQEKKSTASEDSGGEQKQDSTRLVAVLKPWEMRTKTK